MVATPAYWKLLISLRRDIGIKIKTAKGAPNAVLNNMEFAKSWLIPKLTQTYPINDDKMI